MNDSIPLSEQNCVNCGSTELRQDTNGVWHCLYCRSTFRADDPAMIVVDTPKAQEANENVIDTGDLFTFDQERTLSAHLRRIRDEHDVVVVVETVNTITQNAELYARTRAHELGVGDADKDNGLYILMVRQPRRVQVVAGNGIAPHLNGETITRIVQGVFIPTFKAGDLVKGLSDGADALVETYLANHSGRVSDYTPRAMANTSGGATARGSGGTSWGGWIFFLIVGGLLLWALFAGLGGSGGGGGSDFSGGDDSSWNWDSGGGSDWDSGGGSDFGGGGFDSGSSGGGDW
ncbi:TPM domain-containing protein [Salinibacterium sp. ZJ70]|uniref:TPM domain-containing protein n=1 Tax=Salinibacterium sp. ZJ70 TaxID=2708084 RepID=UPI00141DF754|nr:TPM domain-containing protein [Salinibacterium sp. ZJ70]